MPYAVISRETDGDHQWALVEAQCKLDDAADELVCATAALVRRSFGEEKIIADANELLSVEIAEGRFQLDHLIAAVRRSLPDPAAEGNKPSRLRTDRSQSAEMVAKGALAATYQFEYPAAPQEGATNANQPVLGFDGWGIARLDSGSFALVLIQVKATEDQACPPGVADELASECRRITRNESVLCRALVVLARHLRGEELQAPVLTMLAGFTVGRLPEIYVAPALVRGTVPATLDDMKPVRAIAHELAPGLARGVVVSIGVALAEFGRLVMQKAREAA
jgi:hypothetical protein